MEPVQDQSCDGSQLINLLNAPGTRKTTQKSSGLWGRPWRLKFNTSSGDDYVAVDVCPIVVAVGVDVAVAVAIIDVAWCHCCCCCFDETAVMRGFSSGPCRRTNDFDFNFFPFCLPPTITALPSKADTIRKYLMTAREMFYCYNVPLMPQHRARDVGRLSSIARAPRGPS